MFLSWNHGSAARMNKGKSAVLYHYSIPKKQIQLKVWKLITARQWLPHSKG